jgi:hypothetical protein
LLALKSTMLQDFQCKFCGTKFHKESTLATHVCVKKRRHMDLGSAGSRFGFRAFQRFFELTVKSKKLKTTDEFINSQYYMEFVKFGNHLALLRPIHIERYIDFVIMNGVKLKDWTKDAVYDLYIEHLVQTEPSTSAADRSITEIIEWCDVNNTEFKNFFSAISANEASHLIRTGKISPWVLYLSASGEDLMSRFNEDHAKMIGGVIDPGKWMRKFKKEDTEVQYIKTLLEEAGL